jgi:hypothetical protein
MNPDIAKYALKFLERIQLTPAEIPVFTAVTTELQGLAGATPIAPQGEQNGNSMVHDVPS